MVPNAGIGMVGPIVETDLAAWRAVTSINLDGVFLCLRYAAPAIIASGGGAIVPVASVTATAGSPLIASYAASKAAVVNLTKTAAVWHLYTPITGVLRERSTTALDLAVALHPTPAVGGSPTDRAVAVIDELEGDRGFYAGAVGWCDQRGDGRWVVSIRCAQLSADRRTVKVIFYAGASTDEIRVILEDQHKDL